MAWFIISIIAVITAFVGFGFKVETNTTTDSLGNEKTNSALIWKFRPKQALALIFALICLLGTFTKIPANSVGIVYSPFSGTKEETLSEGFRGKGIFDKVYKISTEVKTMTVENLTTQTKDAQYLNSTLDVKYRVNSSNAYLVFKQFRTLDKMSESLIIPTTQRVLEQITTKYNVIDILGEKRTEVYSKLETELAAEFAKFGVEFYSISITDMDAGEALEKAISEEAVAKKAVETAEQNLLKTEMEAKEQAVKAQAEQDAAKIKAETKIIEAEAEKKANDLLNKSLTDEILRQQWIEKWDGKMPTYYSGEDGGAGIIINPGE